MGEHARGETLSVAFAGESQHQDASAKMVHRAPGTSSQIISKSVTRAGGRHVVSRPGSGAGGHGAFQVTVRCDALLVDSISRSDT